MKHVLIDRPRSGSHFGKQAKGSRRQLTGRYQQIEDYPFKESVRKPWIVANQEKQFSDHISPLERFLRTKIGKKWDDVYSEVRKHVSPNSKMQLHLLEHCYDFVETKVHIINGIPYDERFHLVLGSQYRMQLYVDPEDGILKQAPLERFSWKNQKKKESLWANEKKLQQYILYKRIWYLVQLQKYKDKPYYLRDDQWNNYMRELLKKDCFFKKQYSDWHSVESMIKEVVQLYGYYYIGIWKRQLNTKEIERMKHNET